MLPGQNVSLLRQASAVCVNSTSPRLPYCRGVDRTEQVQAFVADWLAEPPEIAAARARAQEVGVTPVSPAVGSLLRALATLLRARTVVETGTGTGVSGLWLLAGMQPDGVLTSIDDEPEQVRLAKQTFSSAGFSSARARVIGGPALDVLPRLTDGGYDLVFLDAAITEVGPQLAEARRLVREQGMVVAHGVLRPGRAADPVNRDAESVAIREMLTALAADEDAKPALLPIGDGLLLLPA